MAESANSTQAESKSLQFRFFSQPLCLPEGEIWQQRPGDIEQIKGGGVVSHPRKDWTVKVVFKPLISRRLLSNELVCTRPSK